jgi:hypothetical protein
VPLKKGIGSEREDLPLKITLMCWRCQWWTKHDLINEHGVVQRGFEKLGRMPNHI